MKRLISIICILALLLCSMTACLSNKNGSKNNDDDDDDKTTDDSGNDDTDDGTDNSGGDQTPPSSTVLTVATELAGKVECLTSTQNLLTYGSVSGGDSDGNILGGGAISKTNAKVAYTPDKNDVGTLDVNSDFEFSDRMIDEIKQLKNSALTTCKCLNKWVKESEGAYSRMFRLNYDINTNTVTVESRPHRSDYNTYRCYTVTYDASGRLKIDGYSATFNETYIIQVDSLHYLEGVYFSYLSNYENREEALSNQERNLFIDLENKVCSSIHIDAHKLYDANGNLIIEEYADAPSISFSYQRGDYFIATNYGVYIDSENPVIGFDLAYTNGAAIGTFTGAGCALNMNYFDGWSSVSRTGDTITLTTDKGSFDSLGFTQTSLTNDIAYMINYYETSDIYPTIFVYNTSGSKDWNGSEIHAVFDTLEAELGLKLDEEIESRLVETKSEYDEISKNFHYINGIYADGLTTEEYFMILDMLQPIEYTLEELYAFYDDPAIEKNEQSETYEYFEFLDFTLIGNAVVDPQTYDISLTGISASIAPSLMLKDGGKYSLVFAWASSTELSEVGRVDVTYTGQTLEFTSDATVSASVMPKDFGEHILVAYIAFNEDTYKTRISKTFNITTQTEITGELATNAVATAFSADSTAITVLNTVVVPDPAPTDPS